MTEVRVLRAPRRFTDRFLANLPATGTRYELRDATGLEVRVGRRGRRTFTQVCRLGAATVRVTLGVYHADAPEGAGLTLAEANQRVSDNLRLIAKGIDPRTGVTPGAAVPGTIADLADQFYRRRIVPRRRRPDLVKDVLGREVVPQLGKLKVKDVDAPAVARMVEAVVDRGAPAYAVRVLAVAKQLLGFAVARGYLPFNPAASLRRDDLGAGIRTRKRALSLEELAALLALLEQRGGRMPVQSRLAVKLLLLTGVRSAELRLARWEHVDFKRALWTVPVSKTTRHDETAPAPFLVPLAPAALAAFRELKAVAGDSPWCVPSDVDPARPFERSGFSRIGQELGRRMRVGEAPAPPWTLHDLRRTLRTGLARLRVAPHVCERCLNHSLGKIADVYDVHDYLDERREALAEWEALLARLTAGEDNVVALRGAQA